MLKNRKRTKKTCANKRCGKMFTVPPKFRHQTYCSRGCFLQDKKRQNWQDNARNVAVFALFWALSWALPAHSHHISDPAATFEPIFRQAIVHFWSDTEHTWELLSQLALAESSYNPQARSPVGAVGLMQIMPKTWQEIADDLPSIGHDIDDARDNALAGAYYLRRMYNLWKEPRPEEDRLFLSLACYNAGPGNLLRAQRIARAEGLEGRTWPDVKSRLAQVTGQHADGTINYAEKIVSRYRLGRTQSRRLLTEQTAAQKDAAPSQDRAKKQAEQAEGYSTAQGKQEAPPPVHIYVHTRSVDPPLPWDKPLLFIAYTLLQLARRSDYGQSNPEA